MTPPPSPFESFVGLRIMRSPARRRGVFGITIIVMLLLTLFPERYRAAVSLTPTDPTTLGLSGALGQLGAINSVFGNQAQVEVALKIARSVYLREMVSKRLKLVEKLGLQNEDAATRWLESHVSHRVMRGGIVESETYVKDPEFGQQLMTVYADAIQTRLAEIARRQTAYKRKVLEQLVTDSEQQLQKAQREYNQFRVQSRYSDPQSAIAAIGDRVPALQAAIRAKEVELSVARQSATDQNILVRDIIVSIASLKAQLAQFQAKNPQQESSVGLVVNQSTEAKRLERRLLLAQTLYDGYTRYLQGTSVEDLTSTATVRILEDPFVDTDRQYNMVPLGLAVFLVLLALAIEFYQARPPVGRRKAFADE